MPNGKPGDHPFTDIVIHGLDVYSSQVAKLVREIAKLASDQERRKLSDLLYQDYNEYSDPDVEELKRVLTDLRDKLLRDARERGWEV